jgi:ABC-type branched-subunit amino acid transport system ATPase component
MITHKLEADSMWLEYKDRKILQSVYMQLETGKATGLLGRNGTGKSSLLQMIFGSLKGQNQSVRWNGEYVAEPYECQGLIRHLPQLSFVPGSMKIERLCSMYQVSFNRIADFFPELKDYLHVPASKLSGGNKRLMETMLILLSPVKFVLLDEPFTHLSPRTVETLATVIGQEKQNKGVLVSDHAYQHVTNLSDDLYLIVPVGRCVLLKDPVKDMKLMGYTR